MNFKFEGIFAKEFIISHIITKPCTAPQLQANSPPLKNYHLYTRGQVDFKNALLMLHEKHKKKCFPRSMGSTISTFATPPQQNEHFFFGKITAEGCQKWQNMILTLHEKQKKKTFLAEHEKHDFDFCNPSRMILILLAGFARLRPVLAGSVRFWPVFVPFCDISKEVSPPLVAPGVRMT